MWRLLILCIYNLYLRPTPLILDEEGRTIDAKTGQAIQLQHHTPTLKVIIIVDVSFSIQYKLDFLKVFAWKIQASLHKCLPVFTHLNSWSSLSYLRQNIHKIVCRSVINIVFISLSSLFYFCSSDYTARIINIYILFLFFFCCMIKLFHLQ